MAKFVQVAKSAEIADRSAKCVEVEGKRIAIFNLGGEFFNPLFAQRREVVAACRIVSTVWVAGHLSWVSLIHGLLRVHSGSLQYKGRQQSESEHGDRNEPHSGSLLTFLY